MSNNLLFSALLLALLFFVTACEPEFIPAAETESELSFFPIDSVSTWEYRMDSVIYDNMGMSIDTFVSYRKETVMGSFMDAEGKVTYRLSISKKKDWDDFYKETDIWSFKLNENGFQRTEENLNFVKLKFPIVIGASWEGNQFPADVEVDVSGDAIEVYKAWGYEYVDRFASLTFGSESYDDVLHVKQADDVNSIERRFSEEFYSNGVGMVARNMIILNVQCTMDPDPNCENQPWEVKAHQGFILKQRLVDHY